ncbi:MAG: hypothetical protein AAGG55_16145 [Pseudomonadota bacterium]
MAEPMTDFPPVNIVKSGGWVLDGGLEMLVDIVALHYDWYYVSDKEAGMLRPDTAPKPLGPDGLLYHVRFQEAGELDDLWIDGGCYQTLDEAVDGAQWKASTPITWLSSIFILPGH